MSYFIKPNYRRVKFLTCKKLSTKFVCGKMCHRFINSVHVYFNIIYSYIKEIYVETNISMCTYMCVYHKNTSCPLNKVVQINLIKI